MEIDQPTKVKFMTASEFKKYKNGKTHSLLRPSSKSRPSGSSALRQHVERDDREGLATTQPMDLKASCRVMMPDRQVVTASRPMRLPTACPRLAGQRGGGGHQPGRPERGMMGPRPRMP